MTDNAWSRRACWNQQHVTTASTMPTSEVSRPPRFLAELVDPTALRAGTPLLVTPFRHGADFLRALSIGRDLSLRLVLRTRADPPARSEVIVETLWPGLPNRTYLRATVLGRISHGRLVLQLHPEEHAKLDFLSRVATGDEANPHRRRHSRYCVRLPIAWRPFGARQMITAVTEDLSSGGVQVLTTAAPVGPGARVVLRLHTDVASPDVILTGSVRHIRAGDPGAMSLGIAFENPTSGELRVLRRLLRAFATTGIVLFDPDL